MSYHIWDTSTWLSHSHLQLNYPKLNLSPIFLPPGLRCFSCPSSAQGPAIHPGARPRCLGAPRLLCQTHPLPILPLREKHSQHQLIPLLHGQLIMHQSKVFLTLDQADPTSVLRNLFPVLIVLPPSNLSEIFYDHLLKFCPLHQKVDTKRQGVRLPSLFTMLSRYLDGQGVSVG